MEYYIFRHGKTLFSGENDGDYGDQVETAEILPEAVGSIKKLGNYLKDVKTDFNVSSPFVRCRQTVEIVTSISKKVFSFDSLLHDYDPRYETITDTAKRLESFYLKLTTNNLKPTSVCICTHGYPIAMLKGLILNGSVDLSKIDDYPTTGALLVIKNGKPEVIDFN